MIDEGDFFGRARDLEQLEQLVEPAGALVTIVGPPGVGKTRLALELVHRLRASDHLVCDLGDVRTSEAMLALLAERLHVGSGRSPMLEQVGDALAEREGLLVVFDNVEQLVDVAAGDLRALRAASPHTRWLVTSRSPLGLPGEWRHEIAPLAESEASSMLAHRVTRARGSAPDSGELAVLARIAVALDGLPLALELAASRIAVIGAAAVEGRLGKQRELRSAIAWSWDLLGDDERRALAQVSVFRGGFDVAAVEAVIEAGASAVDLLQALRDKSLLYTRSDETGATRFGMYLSIREFAASELAAEDAARAHDRHARFFAARTESTRDPDRLLADRDNIFVAIERCIARASRESLSLAARLLLGLAVLIDRSPLDPYLERLEGFLATSESAELLSADLRCAIQITAGRCMRRLARLRDAKRMYADALALARAIGATAHEARLHSELGMVAFFEGRHADALAQWRRSMAMSRELGDERRLALDQTRCGMILRESYRLDEARHTLGEVLALHRRDGDADGLVITLTELAQVHLELAETDQALALIAEASQVPATNLTLLSKTAVLARTAFAHWQREDYAQGEAFAQRAFVHLARIGYRRVEAGLSLYLAIARYLAGVARPIEELEWARRNLAGDPRAEHLTGAWLAHLAIAEHPDTSRTMFEALQPRVDGDPLALVGEILRLPLDVTDPVVRAARARELGASVLGADGRRASDISLDVRFALRAIVNAHVALVHDPADAAGLLEVRADGVAFNYDGSTRSLTRYRTLRRLLLKLVDTRLAAPTTSLAWDQLFAVGWPGERAHDDAARNRVKVAVSTLRSMGLRDAIVHDGSGYLIPSTIDVRVVRRD